MDTLTNLYLEHVNAIIRNSDVIDENDDIIKSIMGEYNKLPSGQQYGVLTEFNKRLDDRRKELNMQKDTTTDQNWLKSAKFHIALLKQKQQYLPKHSFFNKTSVAPLQPNEITLISLENEIERQLALYPPNKYGENYVGGKRHKSKRRKRTHKRR